MNEIEKLDNARIEALDFEAPSGEVEAVKFTLTAFHFVLLFLAFLSILFLSLRINLLVVVKEDRMKRSWRAEVFSVSI